MSGTGFMVSQLGRLSYSTRAQAKYQMACAGNGEGSARRYEQGLAELASGWQPWGVQPWKVQVSGWLTAYRRPGRLPALPQVWCLNRQPNA